jgi:alcohol dehydrogenase
MKAIYFNEHGDLDVLRYGDVPEPDVPPGWVKLRVRACSLNYMDVFARRGMPGIKVQLPGITGCDCAASIAALGDGVQGWTVGQRVLAYPPDVDWTKGHLDLLGETRNGALAEFCIVRAKQLMPIPDHVADEDAASLPCAYGTAYRMMYTRGQVKAGEKVLILGASGGVGNAALLFAKMAGAYVIAAAGSAEKCARLKALGADETIDYSTTEFDRYIRERTGSLLRGGGCDVVVNFTGGDTWAKSIRCVKRHGRLLTCGGTAGYFPPTDIRYIFTAEMEIRGSTGWTFEEQETLLELVSDGRLKPVIGGVYPLRDGIAAIRALEDRNFFGKIIVKPEAGAA